jgi:Uma2 family endonuclease
MPTQTPNYLEAIEHLTEGATLLLPNITWEEYETLLEEMTAWPGMRVTYDKGTVKVMSPLLEHEDYKSFVQDLARAFSDETDIEVEIKGSTTFKKKKNDQGLEPDCCFYVEHAKQVIGKRRIDLSVDPPPDVAVEIDVTSDSSDKFSLYAALGVPELWIYNGKRMRFYQLIETSCVEIESSLSFPSLTADVMTSFLERSKTEGQTAALRAFRQWARAM